CCRRSEWLGRGTTPDNCATQSVATSALSTWLGQAGEPTATSASPHRSGVVEYRPVGVCTAGPRFATICQPSGIILPGRYRSPCPSEAPCTKGYLASVVSFTSIPFQLPPV